MVSRKHPRKEVVVEGQWLKAKKYCASDTPKKVWLAFALFYMFSFSSIDEQFPLTMIIILTDQTKHGRKRDLTAFRSSYARVLPTTLSIQPIRVVFQPRTFFSFSIHKYHNYIGHYESIVILPRKCVTATITQPIHGL